MLFPFHSTGRGGGVGGLGSCLGMSVYEVNKQVSRMHLPFYPFTKQIVNLHVHVWWNLTMKYVDKHDTYVIIPFINGIINCFPSSHRSQLWWGLRGCSGTCFLSLKRTHSNTYSLSSTLFRASMSSWRSSQTSACTHSFRTGGTLSKDVRTSMSCHAGMEAQHVYRYPVHVTYP